MNIPLRARFIDVFNLIIAKGASFFLTAILFAFISKGMDSLAFAEFGYWWSIGVMVGGLLLGGVSSSLVRLTAMGGTLRDLRLPSRDAVLVVAGVAVFAATVAASWLEWTYWVTLWPAVAAFGVVLQCQSALLSLLRAVEATRANALASAFIVAMVPLSLYLALGSQRALLPVFLTLACAYTFGTAGAFAITRSTFASIFVRPGKSALTSGSFAANTVAFTVVNFFSYAVVNVDFTLFRLIGTPQDFATMAGCKIFFERFLLPLLLVFAGAVSLRVLRKSPGSDRILLELRLSPTTVGLALLGVVGLALAYTGFASNLHSDAVVLPWYWACCAVAGYLLYTLNAILFDVLVVIHRPAIVLIYVIASLVLGGAIQATAIVGFGVAGWALGWLVFNFLIAIALAREGLQLRLAGWAWPSVDR